MKDTTWMHLLNKPLIKIAGILLAVLALILVIKSEMQKTPMVSLSFEQEEDHEEHGHDEKGKEGHEAEEHDDHDGHDSHDENGEHDEHGEHDENSVAITPGEMAEFNIKPATAGPGKLKTYISLPGEIVVNADRLAHIVPRVSGVVLEVRNNLGDIVKRGHIMAILESTELGEAKTEYFQRKKLLEINETDLSRAQTIHENVLTLLQILKSLPDPELALEKTKDLDMGKNRRLLITAYTNFLLTRETYRREKNLYEKKISSQSDYLLAESNYKSAQATYAATFDEVSFAIKRQLLEKSRAVEVARIALRASERHLHVLGITEKQIQRLEDGEEEELKLSRVQIPAPITGTVIEKHITLGEMLKKDAKAFMLADLKSVWVNFSVYQKDMPLIRKGMEVIISAGKGIPEAKGTISYVRSLVGEETRTALARVVLPNPGGLWRPGLFVTGKVLSEEISLPLFIPKTALQTIEGQTVVFVNADEGFQPQPVTIGKTSATHAEITSGMKPGQQYIAEGGFTLKAQLAKGGFEAGHHH